jgi:hypothetical protein
VTRDSFITRSARHSPVHRKSILNGYSEVGGRTAGGDTTTCGLAPAPIQLPQLGVVYLARKIAGKASTPPVSALSPNRSESPHICRVQQRNLHHV